MKGLRCSNTPDECKTGSIFSSVKQRVLFRAGIKPSLTNPKYGGQIIEITSCLTLF